MVDSAAETVLYNGSRAMRTNERASARAKALIRRVTPFHVWVRERPRSEVETEAYWQILRALAREVADPSPRSITVRPGRPPRFAY